MPLPQREVHTPSVVTHNAPEAPSGVLAREVLIGAICVSVAVIGLGLMVGAGALPDPRSEDGPGAALGFLYSPLSLLLGAGLYAGFARLLEGERTPPLVTPGERPSALSAWGTTLSHIALAILGSYAIGLLMSLAGFPVVEQASILEITSGGLSLRPALVLLGVTALVAAPIAEELLLRGLFFRRLWQQATPEIAYLASAIAFAAIHGNPQGVLVYLWLGLIFARAYARTGRLWCAVVTHFGNNAVTLAILVLAGGHNAP